MSDEQTTTDVEAAGGNLPPIRVYVAGPYSKGDVAGNVRNAIAAGNALLDAGLVPFVPHAMTDRWHALYPRPYQEWLAYDNHWTRQCNALLRLPGESGGSDAEVALARSIGLPVFFDEAGLLAWAQAQPEVKVEIDKEDWAEDRKVIDATPLGPWQVRPNEGDDWGFVRGPSNAVIARASEGVPWRPGREERWSVHREAGTDPFQPVADFIARARARWPAALAEVDRLTAERDRLAARLAELTTVATAVLNAHEQVKLTSHLLPAGEYEDDRDAFIRDWGAAVDRDATARDALADLLRSNRDDEPKAEAV